MLFTNTNKRENEEWIENIVTNKIIYFSCLNFLYYYEMKEFAE